MSSNSSTKVCFNSKCNGPLERSRKGWRRRTGEFADLCERCASSYEEGKFCQTFHMPASGWRCCESCGKQIHCGCIVSFHMFVLLDAGGIECINCARKSFILTPNPAWPPPSLFIPAMSERSKDAPPRTWCQLAGSGPVPWRQAPSLFSSLSAQSDLQPRVPLDTSGVDRTVSHDTVSASFSETKKTEGSEMLRNGSLKFSASQLLRNRNAGINHGELANSYVNVPQKPSFVRNDLSASPLALAPSSALPNEAHDRNNVVSTQAPGLTPPLLNGKQLSRPNMADILTETQMRHEANDRKNVVSTQAPGLTPSLLNGKQLSRQNIANSLIENQIRNGRPGDARAPNQLLPRYWPRITDQELQKISGDSNSIVTPLFEKMLSASDAGRVGRLVLPKRCAEAYFPTISQPEGLPIKVQDSKGNEWVFQFRFWPNNNSRMYVLEGVTPCMQSMQLQAGDIITFSRMDPEGKLLMGFRKASTVSSSDQGGGSANFINGGSVNGDVSTKKSQAGEVLASDKILPDTPTIDKANLTRQTSPLPKDDRYVAKEVVGAIYSKRRQNTLGSNNKRSRIEDEEPSQLYLTPKEAQQVLRPPLDCGPAAVVIEGVEFEEYKDEPIFGRPTIFGMDLMGQQIQWAQCEDCLKWRKVPADAVLPLGWTCPGNRWDPERSMCSAAQELTLEQLEDLLNPDDSKATKDDPSSAEPLGLDALADLAIQEKGETSSQATTRHPRHRPGCLCIVCIQPPSGKGPKHKPTCTCNVCSSLKRRFNTLMLRREKKQLEKVAEAANQKLQQQSRVHEKWSDDADPEGMMSLLTPLKAQIDLNMKPDKDEELSHGAESASAVKLLQDAYPDQDILSSEDKDSSSDPADLDADGENVSQEEGPPSPKAPAS